MPVYPDDGQYTHKSAGPQTSTNSWEDLATIDVQDWPEKTLRFINQDNNSNSVDVRVRVSLDYGDTFPEIAISSTSVGAGASILRNMEEAVSTIKVQIKSTSNGNPDGMAVEMGLMNPAGS